MALGIGPEKEIEVGAGESLAFCYQADTLVPQLLGGSFLYSARYRTRVLQGDIIVRTVVELITILQQSQRFDC